MANEKWTFSGSIMQKEISQTIPVELSSFIKWLITGEKCLTV